METKVRRMRDNRNSHNENARGLRILVMLCKNKRKAYDSIDEMKAKQKEIRDQARVHKAGEMKFKGISEK